MTVANFAERDWVISISWQYHVTCDTRIWGDYYSLKCNAHCINGII